MEFFRYSNDDKKKTLIALLAQAKQSDDVNHANESRFITDVGYSLGLSDEEISDIEQGKYDFETTLPKNEEERMMFFMHVIHLIKIDHKIVPKEEALLKDIGLKLGINPMLIDDLVKAYRYEVATGYKLTAEKMTEIIRKYLN